MRQLVITSLKNAKRFVVQRLRISLLLTFATAIIAALFTSYTHYLGAVSWIAIPGIWAIGFLYIADAMRLVFLPDYKLTLTNILKLTGVGIVILGIAYLCAFTFGTALSRLHLTRFNFDELYRVAFYTVFVVFGTKFAFASFALKDYGVFGACARSWRLTGGAAFWPTLLIFGPFYLAAILLQRGLWTVHTLIAPAAWTVAHVVVMYAYNILVDAFVYVLLARWMLVRESAVGTLPLVPAYDHQSGLQREQR